VRLWLKSSGCTVKKNKEKAEIKTNNRMLIATPRLKERKRVSITIMRLARKINPLRVLSH
jgi:hypothetical protein